LLENLENSWGNKQFGAIKATGVLSALSAQRSRSLSPLHIDYRRLREHNKMYTFKTNKISL